MNKKKINTKDPPSLTLLFCRCNMNRIIRVTFVILLQLYTVFTSKILFILWVTAHHQHQTKRRLPNTFVV